MTTRRTPDGQVYTEVPVVPRHDQLDGRSLGNSHPISAITGLQEALDSKADAVDGGSLVTDEEKAKIETMEANAQENVIETVKVNGTPLVPDASKAVDVEVPTDIGNRLNYVAASGRLELLHFFSTQFHPAISSVILPRKGLTAMALDSDSKALTATLQDGTTVSVDLSDAADPYTAGNGLSLADGAFSLSSQTQGLMEDLADHLSDQTAHVSAADRTKWDGVATNAVKVTGNQTIAGNKTFSSPVTVGTPTAVSHAATKAYVDDAIAAATGGDYVVAEADTLGSQLFEGLFAMVSSQGGVYVYKATTDVQLCLRVGAMWPDHDALLSVNIPRGSYVPDTLSASGVMGDSTSCALRLSLGGVCTGSGMDAVLVATYAGDAPAWGVMDCPMTYTETPFALPPEPEEGDMAGASVSLLYRPGGGR